MAKKSVKETKKISPKKKKIINNISLILFFIYFLIAIFLTINIFKLNMIPFKFAIIIFLIGIIFTSVVAFFSLNKKIKWKIKIVFDVILVLISSGLLFANHYIDKTIDFFKTITSDNYEVENYYVLALKESSLENEKDLLDKKVGIVENLGTINEALDELKSKVTFESVKSKGIFDLGNSLLSKDVDAILIADYHKSILDEEIENFENEVKIIYKIKLKKESTTKAENVDVTKQSFNIFLSGIDTFGEIDSIARSDVNMVVTINPVTKQVLLTSIPRDYYVELSCYHEKDKLTHAGMYGIDCSTGTIENLLDINLNYYVRVNFSSLIKLVDVLDGISVYSDYDFNTYGYQFYKGYNNVNGEYALAFARARYNFIDGDRQRVKNQQAVISAIADKALSPAIISKYTSILDAMKNSFQTNMSMSEIQNLAKFQIDKMPKWTISSISLNGSDSSNYTYSYGSQLLYVMEPDKTTVDYAKETIKKVMIGQPIEIISSVPEKNSNNTVNNTTIKTTTQTIQNTTTMVSTTTTNSTTTTTTTKTTTTTSKKENNSDDEKVNKIDSNNEQKDDELENNIEKDTNDNDENN